MTRFKEAIKMGFQGIHHNSLRMQILCLILFFSLSEAHKTYMGVLKTHVCSFRSVVNDYDYVTQNHFSLLNVGSEKGWGSKKEKALNPSQN